MMIYHQSGEIEIDVDRGVIYFHSATGRTLLRICRLKIPKRYDPQLDMVDITEPERVSYSIRGG